MHVLLAGALSCWVSPAQTEEAATPGKVKRAEEELLLFALNLDRTPLAEAFPAYATASGSYALPLGELCRTLGIGIQVNPSTKQAKGFILKPWPWTGARWNGTTPISMWPSRSCSNGCR
jgi:hypothetical protein